MFDDLAQDEPRKEGLGLASVGSWAAGLLVSALLYATHRFGQGESGLIEVAAFAYVLAVLIAVAASIGFAFSIAALVRARQNRVLGFVGFALNLVTLVVLGVAFLGARSPHGRPIRMSRSFPENTPSTAGHAA